MSFHDSDRAIGLLTHEVSDIDVSVSEEHGGQTKTLGITLLQLVSVSVLAGIIGLLIGAAALPAGLTFSGGGVSWCFLPLVMGVVAIESSWLAGFYWAIRSEKESEDRK